MALKDILVHIDADADSKANKKRQDFAIALASRHDAHLTALILALEPTIPPMIMRDG